MVLGRRGSERRSEERARLRRHERARARCRTAADAPSTTSPVAPAAVPMIESTAVPDVDLAAAGADRGVRARRSASRIRPRASPSPRVPPSRASSTSGVCAPRGRSPAGRRSGRRTSSRAAARQSRSTILPPAPASQPVLERRLVERLVARGQLAARDERAEPERGRGTEAVGSVRNSRSELIEKSRPSS